MIEDNKQGTSASSGSGHTPLSEPTPHDCGTTSTPPVCHLLDQHTYLSPLHPTMVILLMQLVTKGGDSMIPWLQVQDYKTRLQDYKSIPRLQDFSKEKYSTKRSNMIHPPSSLCHSKRHQHNMLWPLNHQTRLPEIWSATQTVTEYPTHLSQPGKVMKVWKEQTLTRWDEAAMISEDASL